MNTENIKKFINYGNKVTSETVYTMFAGVGCVSLLAWCWSYNIKTAIFYIIPAVTISAIFFVIYLLLGQKRNSQKNIFLFIGIGSTLGTATCQMGCFLAGWLTIKKKLLLLLFLLIFTILIYLCMFIISKVMIKNIQNLSATEKVSIALIAPFAALGVILSSKIGYSGNIIVFAFAILSFVFSAFSIYFIKYYYILKTEKSHGNAK